MALVKNEKDRHGLILIAVVVAATVVMAVVYQQIKRKQAYDERTLCPLHVEYASTILIIDKSDPWLASDAEKIRSLVMGLAETLERYERFEVHVIHSDGGDGRPVISTYFDMCNPGSDANPLYQNPKTVEKRYRNMFEGPLQKMVEFLASPGRARKTPLLHAMATAVSESSSRNIRLVIVSDLMENGTRFNFYRKIPAAEEIYAAYPIDGDRVREIRIKYIRRNNIPPPLEKKVLEVFRQVAAHAKASYQVDPFLEP